MGNQISQFDVDKLGHYADIFPGFAFKSERFTDDPADVVLVKGENVQQGFIDWGASKYWPFIEAEAQKKYELHVGDVVLAMDRPWVTAGLKWAYIKPHDPKSLLVQRVSRLRAKNGLNQTYLRCLISSGYFSSYIQPIVTGVNVPHISGKQIGDFKIPLPPLPIQQKIAAIISAYDNLIENNQRRIALLEKMAEELYREWFVRMRFPGHEQVKKVKGVPEGWSVRKISDLADFLSGYSFKSETYTPTGKYGVVTIKNVQDGYFIPECSDFIEGAPSNMKEHCYLQAGDVLMSLTGNVGRVCHVYGNNLLLNQRVAKLVPKISNASQFVFYTFNNQSMIQLVENLSLGSTAQMNLSPILLGKQKLVIPSDDLLVRFEEVTQPMHQKKMLLLQKNRLLEKFRNQLLPRLISGKLSVEHLDIQFPPGMEETA